MTKYTKEYLNTLLDVDVAVLLCQKLGYLVSSFTFEGILTISTRFKTTTFDLMDWNDIMPLVVDYKLSTVNVNGDDMWKVRNVEADVEVWDKSPQRAVACCLLMMDLGE